MPTCLSNPRAKNLRPYKILFVLLFSPLLFFGQTLTGLWTGALSTDSNTVRKDQLFEIALTEYRGKVYGYSRSEFIVNDTLYYILKRVKGTITGDICEVTDDEIIAFNFPGKLDKGVKVTSTFKRNKSDSTWYLAGTWKTNATKKYFSLTGKVDLEQEKDLTASKIFPHLEELKIADEVTFYKERKEGAPIVRLARPERIKTEYRTHDVLPTDPGKVVYDPPVVEKSIKDPDALAVTAVGKEKTAPLIPVKNEDEVATKPTAQLLPVSTVAEKKDEPRPTQTVGEKPVAEKDLVVNNVKNNKTVAVTEIRQEKTVPPLKTVTDNNKKDAPVVAKNKEPQKEAQKVSTIVNAPKEKPVTADLVKTDVAKATVTPSVGTTTIIPAVPEKKDIPIEEVIKKSASIGGRKSEFTQEVMFRSDSLELSLYDNGEIDGDTVSVYMNGEVIMARQGLKASAIKKTIYLTPDATGDFTLVLFAENLGKYPPNTGLLVVHDGEDVYNLRFSSDFQKSTGIVFRRKK